MPRQPRIHFENPIAALEAEFGAEVQEGVRRVATPLGELGEQCEQSCLPHNDLNPTQRAHRIEEAQELYEFRYDWENAPGVPLLKRVPLREIFSPRYLAETAAAGFKIRANDALNPRHHDYDRAEDIGDYADLFRVLPDPMVSKGHLWASDESFGEQRLSGANPILLEQVASAEDIKDYWRGSTSRRLPGTTLEDEVRAGRIYLVDHREALKPVNDTTPIDIDGTTFTKRMPKTVGIFWWNRWTQRLLPFSVYIEGTPPTIASPEDDGATWLAAKTAFQAADGVVHEMSSHLGRTHLAIEGIAIAAHRALDAHHPVLQLLLPHLRFMFMLNFLAERSLIAPGSDVATSFGGPIKQIVAVAGHARATWNFTHHALKNDLRGRRVADAKELPHYPYRDDALLVWGAIEEYVDEYLDLYYSNDESVRTDSELQAWAQIISAKADDTHKGAGVLGFPALTMKEQLTFALTHIIFVCSAQHSAVNFGQSDYLAYAPNSPFAIWSEPTNPNILELLPPMGPAEGQLETLAQLTAFRYDKLGDYSGRYTKDDRANRIIRKFYQKLGTIDAEIQARDAQRWQSYPYLRPRLILNSISI